MATPPDDRSLPGLPGPTDEHTRAILEPLLACATVGLGFLDTRHRFAYLNPTLALINGAPVADLVGRAVTEVFPRVADEVTVICRQVLLAGRPVVNVEYDRPAHGADPARAWVADYFPVRAPGGAVMGVGVVVVDVTDRRLAAESRVRPAAAAAGELSAALLAARALAHRINNQLALAGGYAELLAAHTGHSPDTEQYVTGMLHGLQAASQAVLDLQEIVLRAPPPSPASG